MSIIFLDIDGVLVTMNSVSPFVFDPKCVKKLNVILKETDADIVVSSTWRVIEPIERLIKKFKVEGVEGRIISITPVLNGDDNSRGNEIAKWIQENNFKGKFIVIDDDSDIEPFEKVWVQTTWENGLTDSNVEQAIHLLKG